jgi:hypothetical protein
MHTRPFVVAFVVATLIVVSIGFRILTQDHTTLHDLVKGNQTSSKLEYRRQAEADLVLCDAINTAQPHPILNCPKIRDEAEARVSAIR